MTASEMRQLWRLLSQTWGARFVDQYGPQPNDAWAAALAEADLESARDAYRALVFSGSPHPPTLPEFVVGVRKALRDRIVAGRNAELLSALPERCSAEQARENLEKLRRTLNG